MARGPEAYQLYRQAISEGKKAIRRTRLMLVGQERVGKTSLMKTLINQKYVCDEIGCILTYRTKCICSYVKDIKE